MSVMFQVHFPTNKNITTRNTVIMCWKSFAVCGVVFSNCDAANILTKARVSDYTQFTHRIKRKPCILYFYLDFKSTSLDSLTLY